MNAPLAIPTTLRNRPTDIAAPDRDELLQASRRVDWRFLLPQPDLAATAYVGDTDTNLIESLQKFCSSLTFLTRETRNQASTTRFSLVVASNPNQHELAQAAQSTATGGFVYVEVCSRRSQRRLRGEKSCSMSGVNSYLNAMRQLHLSDLQAHWHWPNFESCTEIIPLHDPAAVFCALRRRGSGFRSRWKSAFARLLLKSHLLVRLVPCFSALGRQCQSQDSNNRPTTVLDM